MAARSPFTRGVPSADLLPVDDIRAAAAGARARRRRRALLRAGRVPAAARVDRRAARRAGRPGADGQRLAGGRWHSWPSSFFARPAGAAMVEDPTYDRTLIALRARRRRGARRRRCEPTASTWTALGAALAERPPRLIYLIPTFQNPSGVMHVARQAAAGGGARPRARRAGDRGRPLRSAAVRGRAAADAARARRRRERDLLLLVHQDDRARPAHRLSGAARAAGRADRDALRPTPTSRPTRSPRRRSRRTAGPVASSPTWTARPSRSRPAAMQWNWRCASTSPPAAAGRPRPVDTSSGCSCRKGSTPQPRWRRRPRPACRTWPGPTSPARTTAGVCLRLASARCRRADRGGIGAWAECSRPATDPSV